MNSLFVRSTHIVASCEMDLYEFPMDVQHCKLTFGSCKSAFDMIFRHHMEGHKYIKYACLNYSLVGPLFVRGAKKNKNCVKGIISVTGFRSVCGRSKKQEGERKTSRVWERKRDGRIFSINRLHQPNLATV